MSKYKLTLSDEQKELLLYLDNTRFEYDKLQRINKDIINDNLFYNKWYIEQNSTKIKANWVHYFQFLKNVCYRYNDELNPDTKLNLDNGSFESLARYLYLREIQNKQFTYQTGLDALNTMIKEIGDYTN